MPIDIASSSDPTALQVALSFLLVLLGWVVFIGLVFAVLRGALSDAEADRRAQVRGQLASLSLATVTIPADGADALDDYLGRLQEAVGDDTATVDEDVALPPTATGALGDLRDAWRTRTAQVPRLALWAGYEAVVLAVLWVLVAVPARAIRRGLTGDGGLPNPALVVTAAGDVVGLLVDLLGLFPATNLAWALLLTVVLDLYSLLSAHALVFAVLLAAGSLAVTVLDRRTDTALRRSLYPDRRALARRLLAVATVTWATGSVVAGLGGLLGLPALGNVAGGVLALLVLARYALRGARGLAVRLIDRHDELTTNLADEFVVFNEGDGWTRDRAVVAAYLLTRKALAGLGLALVPVLVEYGYRAVVEGGIASTVGAVAAAPPLTQAAVGLVVLATLLLPLRLDAAAVTDLLTGLRLGLSRGSTQVRMLAAGSAGLGGLLLAGVALLVGVPWWAAALVGVAVAWLGHRTWRLVASASARQRQRRRDPTPPSYLTAGLGKIVVDGRAIWVGRVETRWVAWPSRERVVDVLRATLTARFSDEAPEPAVEAAYYEEIRTTGRVDPEAFVASRRADASARFRELVRPKTADRDRVDDQLHEEFDARIVAAAKARDIDDGSNVVAAGPISQDGDRYVWHDRERDLLHPDT